MYNNRKATKEENLYIHYIRKLFEEIHKLQKCEKEKKRGEYEKSINSLFLLVSGLMSTL